MQIPNPLLYGYVFSVLYSLFWGWRCLSWEAEAKDNNLRRIINRGLVIGAAVFLLLGLVFASIEGNDVVTMFYAVYVVPLVVGLVAFNAGYWIHMLARIANCAPRVG